MVQTTRPSLLDALLGGTNSLVTDLVSGIATAITGAKRVFLSPDGKNGQWAKISSDYISDVDWYKITNRDPLLNLQIGSPVALEVGATNATGTGALIALANHAHAVPVGAPSDIGTANAPGSSVAFVRQDHVHALPFSTLQAVLGGATGNISVNGVRVTGGGDPVNPQDFVTKSYADAHEAGLVVKNPVNVFATTLTTLSGTGATVDGVTLTAGMDVFVASNPNPLNVGAWRVASGAWTRTPGWEAGNNAKGYYFLVLQGTNYTGTGWTCNGSNDGLYLIGSSLLNWAQFVGASAQVLPGAGLTRTGNTLDVVCDDGSISVLSDAIRVLSVAWSKLTGIPSTFAPSSHAASHRHGGSDEIGYPSNTLSGIMPPIASPYTVYCSTNGTDVVSRQLVDGFIATTAAIQVRKLAKGAAGKLTVLASDGTNDPAYVEPDQLGINPNPVIAQNGTHRATALHNVYVAPREATTSFVFTEAEWKGDANAPLDNPGVGTASVTVQIIGRDPNATPAGVFDWTFKGTMFRYYSGGLGSWVVDKALTQVAALSIGTASTLTCYMGLSGTANGTITVTVVNAASGGVESDFTVIIDIRGSGNYGA